MLAVCTVLHVLLQAIIRFPREPVNSARCGVYACCFPAA